MIDGGRLIDGDRDAAVAPGRCYTAAVERPFAAHPWTVLVVAHPSAGHGVARRAQRLAQGLNRRGRTRAFIDLTGSSTMLSSRGNEPDLRRADDTGGAEVANACEVVVFLHAFGGIPGVLGTDHVAALGACRRPIIAAFHSVPEHPNDEDRRFIDEMATRSEVIVVRSDKDWARLVERHDVSPGRLAVVRREVEVVPRFRRLVQAVIGQG